MGPITNGVITMLIAKALSPCVDKVYQVALTKGPVIAKDYFALWQKNNAAIIGARVQRILEERGYSDETPFRVPSTKFAFSFIQGASIEDQSELQELWAKLLANAVDPSFLEEEIRISFINILKEFSCIDAIILNTIYNIYLDRNAQSALKLLHFSLSKEKLMYSMRDWTHISTDKMLVSLQNLQRLALIKMEIQTEELRQEVQNSPFKTCKILQIPQYTGGYKFTEFGAEFLKACIA